MPDAPVTQEPFPKIGSLIAKMKIYNTSEPALREAIRAAADSGVNPTHHRAFVEYLQSAGQVDTADYVEGIGEGGYRIVLDHYGVIRENPNGSEEPGPDAAPVPLPTDEEIFSFLLDALEQDVNLSDRKKLIKWLRDNDKEGAARWFETLERPDFFKALGSFFANLGKIRAKVPGMMSSASMEEQGPEPGGGGMGQPETTPEPEPEASPEEPAPEEPPEETPEEPEDKPKRPADVNTVIMDMYLEGVDITRRAQLVREMDKAGYNDSAEFIDGLSLTAFYTLLSEFFAGLAKAMGDDEKVAEARPGVHAKTWDTMPPTEREEALVDAGMDRREASEYVHRSWNRLPDEVQMAFSDSLRMLKVEHRKTLAEQSPGTLWVRVGADERVDALVASGEMDADEAGQFARKDWGELPQYVHKAFQKGMMAVTERKRQGIKLPFRRNKMQKTLSKVEAPEELLPAEVEEAVKVCSGLAEEHGIEEAAKRTAQKLGRRSQMPEGLIDKLEVYLGKVMKEAVDTTVTAPPPGSVPTAAAPAAPAPAAPAAPAAEKPEEPEDPEKKKDPEEDEEEPEKETETESFMGEMSRLALMPSKLRMGENGYERVEPPKAVLIERKPLHESTVTGAAGVTGTPGVGVLDVFSYGGYLEKTLPYLVSATVSRMEGDDRSKFVSVFRKFVETNDLVQLVALSGRLADMVEWGDASQEGAELVKSFRFMSDFLNMMRASVDYTKKALSV